MGNHARSIYNADISSLQQLTPEMLKKDFYVFKPENIKHSRRWGNSFSSWREPNTPGLDISFYSSKAGTFNAKIKTADGVVVSETEMEADKGLNILSYDVAFSKAGAMAFRSKSKMELSEAKNGKTYLPKGSYEVEIKGNGKTEKVEFEIE